MPPLAILTARYFDRVWDRHLSFSRYISIWTLALLYIVLGAALVLLPYFRVDLTHHIYPLLIGIAALFILTAGICFFASLMCSLRVIAITMMISLWVTGIAIWYVAPNVSGRSVKPLAEVLNVQLKRYPNAQVINYGNYHQDLPYYIQRLVTIVDWRNELTFGYEHNPEAKNWLIDSATFWQEWQNGNRAYAIMSVNDYKQYAPDHLMFVLAQANNNVLVTNKDPNS
jgi:hypothetical protein